MRDPTPVNGAVLVALAVVAFGALYACAAGPTQGDVCRTQLKAYVAQRFDQKVTSIRLEYAEGTDPLDVSFVVGTAVVFVKECDGYHAFDLFGTYKDCEVRSFRGDPPNFIRYRGSARGC